jgi:hypothetical protein
VEFNINAPKDVIYLSEEPVLVPGPLGHFDDHGTYGSCIVRHEDMLFMYYVGWSPGVRRPLFYAALGLAVSEDGGRSFKKLSPVPIMTRSQYDPCSVLSAYVLKENETWRMWYCSGTKWEEVEGTLHSYYDIKYAESQDGITWKREGIVCIGLRPGEKNTSHPFVWKDNDSYEMWYSFNVDKGYEVGYGQSSDGYAWKRMDDQAGIDVSASGWDSEIVCHPHVFIHDGTKYMLYNGNGFGRDGFGLAVAEDD